MAMTTDPLAVAAYPDGRLFAPPGSAARQTARAFLARGSVGAADILTARDLLALTGADDGDAALHAMLLGLFAALREGELSVRLDPDALRERLREWGGPHAAALGDGVRTGVLGGRWAALVGTDADPEAAVVRTGDGAGARIWFRRWRFIGNALAAEIAARLRNAECDPGALRSDRAARLLAAVRREHVAPEAWNARQTLALYLALRRSFLVISGGPGTGKTSIVLGLLDALRHADMPPGSVRLAAPTGRAAGRMGDALREGVARTGGDADPDRAAYVAAVRPTTLHRLLAYSPSRHRFGRNRNHPLEARVVVVDEASMVDARLMLHLLRATPPETKLVLLGDRHQLPSVEAGAVLADLAPPPDAIRYSDETKRILRDALGVSSDAMTDAAAPPDGTDGLTDAVVFLTENYRAAPALQQFAEAVAGAPLPPDPAAAGAAERIAAWAAPLAVRPSGGADGGAESFAVDWPDADDTDAAGVRRFDPADDPAAWSALLAAWARRWAFRARPDAEAAIADLLREASRFPEAELNGAAAAAIGRLLDAAAAERILTAERRGPRGCNRLNDRIVELLRRPLGGRRRGRHFPGAPVMVNRNDHARGLYNGDVGIVLRFAGAAADRVVFRRGGRLTAHPVETLADRLESAFATTIHKSQGSAFDAALVTLPAVEPATGAAPGDGAPAGDDATEDAPRHLLLTREILYTAVTRARRWVVLCAGQDAVRAAVGRTARRESGLGLDAAAETERAQP